MGTDAGHADTGVQEFARTQTLRRFRMMLECVVPLPGLTLLQDQNPATKYNATMEAPKVKS